MPDLAPPVRVAIVGAGYFAQFHFDAWSRMDDVEFVGVAERNEARGQEMAEAFGTEGAALPVFADAEEMVQALAPDLVDITAPPAAHAGLIRTLVPHVSHIICQKPFCGGIEAAREAIRLAETHGARLAVHENVRFQPWYRAAGRLIAAGAIGTPWQVTFRLRPGDGQGADAYLDRQPYFREMDRFLVHETAIHWIDTFRSLMGEVTGVYAQLTRLNPVITGEDAGVILFDFEGGARGVFDANRLADHAATDRRRTMGEMWVEGSAGTLRLDGEGRLWLRDFGSNDETEQTFEWRDHLFGGDCVHACNRAILDAWLAGEPAPTEARLYLRNQEIEEAIYESAASGLHIAL